MAKTAKNGKMTETMKMAKTAKNGPQLHL